MDNHGTSILRLRRRQQRLWTVRPSETPGLPSWAVGSGSGSVPLPFETWCIQRPLTSVSGCLSARPTGCSSAITGTSTVQASGGSERWSIRSATLSTTTRSWPACRTSDASSGWIAGTSWPGMPGSSRLRARPRCHGTLASTWLRGERSTWVARWCLPELPLFLQAASRPDDAPSGKRGGFCQGWRSHRVAVALTGSVERLPSSPWPGRGRRSRHKRRKNIVDTANLTALVHGGCVRYHDGHRDSTSYSEGAAGGQTDRPGIHQR